MGHLKAIVEFANPKISQRVYELGNEFAEEWDSGEPMMVKEIGKKLQDDLGRIPGRTEESLSVDR